MNIYDEQYEIRLAQVEDIDEIMCFIACYWKKDHILANDREFFEYEHVYHGLVNYIIAKNRRDGKIDGILGFIPANHDKEHFDIWTVMWKVKPGAISLLGLELAKRVKDYTHARTCLGVGDNPKTAIPLLKVLAKYHTGKMVHYYMLSKNSEFKIARIQTYKENLANKEHLRNVNIKRCLDFHKLEKEFVFERYKKIIPYKDKEYVEHRYFNHPIYEYMVWQLENEEKEQALIILREQRCNGSKVLRIIDYIGEQKLFSGLHQFFVERLCDYEYIDFYVLGFEEQYIAEAGFVKHEEEDMNIIPDYFFPFEQRNIDIWCSSSSATPALFVKGDADQDRPNYR